MTCAQGLLRLLWGGGGGGGGGRSWSATGLVVPYNFPRLNRAIIFKVLKQRRIFFTKLSLGRDHRNVSSQF